MLLAFHSKGQQAGKDTAGRFVGEWCVEHGVWFERRAFADKMKLLAARALGIQSVSDAAAVALVDKLKLGGTVAWQIHGLARRTMTGRDFIINLAGDSGDSGARGLFGDNFWTEQALPTATAHGREEHLRGCIAVTDLRFDVEAAHVHRLGGVVVEITNPRAVDPGGRAERGLDSRQVDCYVDNSGTLEEFRARIRRVAAHHCPSSLWPPTRHG